MPFGAAAPVNPYASPNIGYQTPAPQKSKAGRAGLPWEKSRRKDVKAYIDTAKLVSFEPGRAFSMMLQRGDMGGPMMFSMLGLSIGAVANIVWGVPLTYIQMTLLDAPADAIGAAVLMNLIGNVVAGAVGVVLGATLGNLIAAAILHICLLITGGSRQTFDTSFRIVAFSQGSLTWLQLIPVIGPVIQVFWSIGVNIVAVHKAHEVPMGRAALVVLLPLIACFMLLALIGVLFFSVIVAALSQAPR
ncbi:Yip1 domain protein [Anatilimnocola aggregata]|uniref:Yip1 domain protein n=1 Tax=Anatilimnocola aggregata TaxID=2528021 RepID=A0A517Y5W8_9BACT|nr:YIP1 family protein [Anatilimnocola aggregata]QDU25628.1 Yip1 domain protein [Anatilimnocola aggregata]